MSWLDRVRTVLRREAADAAQAWDGLRRRADSELTRREEDLRATPEERLASLQREIDEAGDPFAEVRARLGEVKPADPPSPPNGG